MQEEKVRNNVQPWRQEPCVYLSECNACARVQHAVVKNEPRVRKTFFYLSTSACFEESPAAE